MKNFSADFSCPPVDFLHDFQGIHGLDEIRHGYRFFHFVLLQMPLQVPDDRKREDFMFFFHFLNPVFSHLCHAETDGFFHILKRMEFRHCHQLYFLTIGRPLFRGPDPVPDPG